MESLPLRQIFTSFVRFIEIESDRVLLGHNSTHTPTVGSYCCVNEFLDNTEVSFLLIRNQRGAFHWASKLYVVTHEQHGMKCLFCFLVAGDKDANHDNHRVSHLLGTKTHLQDPAENGSS